VSFLVFRVAPTRELGAFEREMVRRFPAEMRRAGARAGAEGSRLLRALSWEVKDLGVYRDSWKSQEYLTVRGVTVDFWNSAAHAVFVLNGRRAGSAMPPHDPIYEWVMRHIGDPRAVYPIRRAIAIRGIRARPVLRLASSRLERMVEDHYTAAWEAACRKASNAQV
jgi:hypothetical protein